MSNGWHKPTEKMVFGQEIEVAVGVDVDGVSDRVKRVFLFAVGYLRARLPGCRIIVTSGKRDDGIHAEGRALDFVVLGMTNEPAVRQALSVVMGMVQEHFPYGTGSDGKWHWAFVWEVDDAHRTHVHLQQAPL
ncbi:MAG: hypothetical protein GF355_04165 [Candidatus Eisenbacteria bacterium]|nr:hypothetical protein [Candidatus Eisenbacteria bacterium]